jgi:2-polyprenyl-3-methyl-5-hydroxy-6-metoxy-1,4-benzoquinol methylase
MADWDKYYAKGYQPVAPIWMWMKALLSANRLRRQSLLNRQRDYVSLSSRPELFRLHQGMNALLARGEASWRSFDYGAGYFYQSYRDISVTGFRDTEARIETMGLLRRLAGLRVLEIGCNSGFLSCQIASSALRVDALDVAPHLIDIARQVAAYKNIRNCEFHLSSFEEFPEEAKYDIVLSFANHSTYDGNTRHSASEYLAKCRRMLARSGILLFESHPAEYERRPNEAIIAWLREAFHIESAHVLRYGTFLDRDRLFVVARCRE